MRALAILLIVAAGLVLQTSFTRFTVGGGWALDLVLVAVCICALSWGPASGLLAGTLGGLAQDALSGGVLGVGGFSKTLVGFLAGFIGTQFIVAQFFPRLVVFVGGTLLHQLCFWGVYALIDQRSPVVPWSSVLLQAAVNAGLGLLIFQLVELAPGFASRRRERRSRLSSGGRW
ncbi:MAG: rod shape-determining protein MreD [Acidobacteriota bacterium]|nr:rod shape-determining protein MreD [Acidobacteriota bacterium]